MDIKKIIFSNLYAIRDWDMQRHAASMQKILQYKKPDDWVIATNKEITVKAFVNKVAKKLDKLNGKARGEGKRY